MSRRCLAVVATAIIAAALASAATFAAVPADLQPLAFLVGEWKADGAGQPGSGTGAFGFSWSLQNRVIVRNSFAEYPASGSTPASRHDDLMIIYAGPVGVRADYFDNEGHVIRYSVRVPGTNRAVFTSDAVAGEPRFQIRYTLTTEGVLDGEFEIAGLDAPETFKQYLAWRSRKVNVSK